MMVVESWGCWGPEGLKTLRQLAKTAAANAGGNDDATMGQLLQRLCIVIRLAKARAILRLAGQSSPPLRALSASAD